MSEFEERRVAQRRREVRAIGGRGVGPGKVTVLRGQLIEHHVEDQVDWHEMAEALDRARRFALARQQRAWNRVRAWDSPEQAAEAKANSRPEPA
jgi:hypothetical protein